MDVDLSQDAYDQDLTDLTSSDASHMMCDSDLVDKVPILLLIFDAHLPSFALMLMCMLNLAFTDCSRFKLFQHIRRFI